LSLLDQALVYGAGQILDADVRKMLGTIDRSHVLALIQALAASDAEALLAVMADMEPKALDYHQVLGECSEAVLRLTREQWVPGTGFMDYSEPQPWLNIAAAVSAEELQLWYQILLLGRRDMSLALSAKSGFEMTMLRCLAFRPDDGDGQSVTGGSRPSRARAAGVVRPAARSEGIVNEQASNDPSLPKALPTRGHLSAVPKSEPVVPIMPAQWSDPAQFPEWVQSLPLRGALQALLSHCSLLEASPERLRLRLDSKGFSFYTTERVAQLEALIHNLTKLSVAVVMERAPDAAVAAADPSVPRPVNAATTLAERQSTQQRQAQSQAQQLFLSDPVVKALREKFQADVKLETVKPLQRGS